MYWHPTSRLRGPLSRKRTWWTMALAPADAPAVRPRSTDGIRMDLVERVREEIAAGRYDSPEKWDAALERLLARL
ncbi:MAG TPA: flagellar biosynthesis anti-sigma factor FlgM [Gemmataceae bacterium]|nr:flagellar biosynthesis anti-sigma factor FlgM [Gemmataceae bacterium]